MTSWNRLLRAGIACLGMAVLLVGCGVAEPSSSEPPAASTVSPGPGSPDPATATSAVPDDSPLPTPTSETRTTSQPPVTGEVPAVLLDDILADLAGRLGVGVEEIEVVRGQSVVWNDGSLGCPEPGMMYTQALVNGYWVVLEHGGETFDYRASSGGSFRLCENPAAETPGTPADGENK